MGKSEVYAVELNRVQTRKEKLQQDLRSLKLDSWEVKTKQDKVEVLEEIEQFIWNKL